MKLLPDSFLPASVLAVHIRHGGLEAANHLAAPSIYSNGIVGQPAPRGQQLT
jgi:hypothetical protein